MLLDRIGALAGLFVLSPVLLAISLLVWVTHGSPILFRQLRPGLGGRLFELWKFRTMLEGGGRDEGRVTRLGGVLRRCSLDELPELLNVLRGEMSLVGPRPLLPQYLNRYTPQQARRHEVRPGITGWAQVNGRNAISWEEKLALDVWYVDNWTLGLDLRILARTAWQVVRHDGVSHPGFETMPEFRGRTAETDDPAVKDP
jgi:sugar transferase EpsL